MITLYNDELEPVCHVPSYWVPDRWYSDTVQCVMPMRCTSSVLPDDCVLTEAVAHVFELKEVVHARRRYLIVIEGLKALVAHDEVASYPRARDDA